MTLSVKNHWILNVNWLQNQISESLLCNFEKGVKTTKSKKVLKASKFELFASQSSINFSVGALWYAIGIFIKNA